VMMIFVFLALHHSEPDQYRW